MSFSWAPGFRIEGGDCTNQPCNGDQDNSSELDTDEDVGSSSLLECHNESSVEQYLLSRHYRRDFYRKCTRLPDSCSQFLTDSHSPSLPTGHKNFIIPDSSWGPAILSVISDSRESYKLFFRSAKKGMEEHTVRHQEVACAWWRKVLALGPSAWDLIHHIHPELSSSIQKVVYVASLQLSDRLLILDESKPIMNIRVGVIYIEEDQEDEKDFFRNTKGSQAFERFLDIIGDRIDLLDWEHFDGGLDISKGRSGNQSLYTRYRDREIMYHVATMMPFYSNQEQQLQRKKHIGNDRLLIIWKDGHKPYKPDAIHSKANHIIVLVQPYETEDETEDETEKYRVAVASRASVPPFPPPLPDPAIFDAAGLRQFILTKLLEGLGATRFAREFAPLAEMYWTHTITNLVKEFTPNSNG